MGGGGQALILIFLAMALAAGRQKQGLVLEGCWVRAIDVHECRETIFCGVCVCVCACVCVHACNVSEDIHTQANSVKSILSTLTWVLRPGLRSSGLHKCF